VKLLLPEIVFTARATLPCAAIKSLLVTIVYSKHFCRSIDVLHTPSATGFTLSILMVLCTVYLVPGTQKTTNL